MTDPINRFDQPPANAIDVDEELTADDIARDAAIDEEPVEFVEPGQAPKTSA